MRGILFAAALAATAITAGAAGASTIYSNDFSVNTTGFSLSGGAAAENAFVGPERYIGGLTQGATASLTLNTTGLTMLTLTFDLYGILSLDGSSNNGPDPFRLTVVGGPTLLDETFSNFSFQNQTFGPNALDPGHTGSDAALYGHLGYVWPGHGQNGKDTTYHLTYTFAATGNSTVLNFVGASGQGPADERFGIDNVVVSAAVPEPGIWALMILGFGAVGVVIRQRRTSAACA